MSVSNCSCTCSLCLRTNLLSACVVYGVRSVVYGVWCMMYSVMSSYSTNYTREREREGGRDIGAIPITTTPIPNPHCTPPSPLHFIPPSPPPLSRTPSKDGHSTRHTTWDTRMWWDCSNAFAYTSASCTTLTVAGRPAAAAKCSRLNVLSNPHTLGGWVGGIGGGDGWDWRCVGGGGVHHAQSELGIVSLNTQLHHHHYHYTTTYNINNHTAHYT